MAAFIGQHDLRTGQKAGAVVVGNAFRRPMGNRAFYRQVEDENRFRCSRGHDCCGPVLKSVTTAITEISMLHSWVQGYRVLWISNVAVLSAFTIAYDRPLRGYFNPFA